MDLVQQLQPFADDIGMGAYWHALTREIEQDHQDELSRLATRGQMPAQLNQHRPDNNQVLLVEAINGNERKMIHLWAEQNHYQHKAIKTPLFHPVSVFHCNDCHKSYAKSELSQRSDWSTIHPGMSYGIIIRCAVCDNYYDGHNDPDDGLILKGTMTNAVVISHQPINLPKHLVRTDKHQRRKKHHSPEQEDYSLEEMDLRSLKLMGYDEFMNYHQKIPRPVYVPSPAKQARIDNHWSQGGRSTTN